MSSITGEGAAVTLAPVTAPEQVRAPAVSADESAEAECGPRDPEPEPAVPQTALAISPRWIASAPLWMRYAAGSLIATVLSQIALTVAYGLLGATAVVASIAAFFAGTIPNYFLNKAWAWSGHKVSHRRLVVSYLMVIVATNVAAIAMTVAADSVVRAHVRSEGPRTVMLDLSYLTSNLLMFVVKCVLFDGVLFKSRPHGGTAEVEGAPGVRVP